MDADLKDKNDAIKKLSKDLEDLNDELNRKNNENENKILEKTSENKVLLLKIEEINRQLQRKHMKQILFYHYIHKKEKENLVLSLEKQLFNKSAEADQIIRDLQKKNDVNMAALEEKNLALKQSFDEVF